MTRGYLLHRKRHVLPGLLITCFVAFSSSVLLALGFSKHLASVCAFALSFMFLSAIQYAGEEGFMIVLRGETAEVAWGYRLEALALALGLALRTLHLWTSRHSCSLDKCLRGT